MRTLFSRLALAPAALLVALAIFASNALATCGPTTHNPTTSVRGKVISTVTGISATTVDCDETAGYYEIPRGAINVRLTVLSTLNTGFSTGTTFFKAYLVGTNGNPLTATYTRVAGFETAELVVDVAQQVPSASAAPGATVPRFVKVEWAETGSMTSFTATARISYELPMGAGRQYSAEERGG